MASNTFVLKQERAFADGAFENTIWEKDALRLEQYAGRYVQAGCYTTPALRAPDFDRLILSWNAATPAGTAIELSVRVYAANTWSAWMPYGKWSPFLRRASQPAGRHDTEAVWLNTDTVHVDAPEGASLFQLRAGLYTDDARRTPVVHLLAVTVRPLRWQRETGEPVQHRCVPVPAYSQAVRDPRLVGTLCSPTVITMLMNRWGEDLLPEEAAHACCDYSRPDGANSSFAAALAGCYGYECYMAFTDAAGLKKEIKNGFACGVRVCCAGLPACEKDGTPPAPGSTESHMLVVHGFETDADGAEYVLVNDPGASSDENARCRCPLDTFCAVWDGAACLIHGKEGARAIAPPVRVTGELRATELPGEYALYVRGERRSLPTDLCERGGMCTGTVCYTIPDGRAYASTAHKRFYYTDVSQAGNILLDTASMPAGTRITAYIISELGCMTVAELTL